VERRELGRGEQAPGPGGRVLQIGSQRGNFCRG
jgi:hypothetical protein